MAASEQNATRGAEVRSLSSCKTLIIKTLSIHIIMAYLMPISHITCIKSTYIYSQFLTVLLHPARCFETPSTSPSGRDLLVQLPNCD